METSLTNELARLKENLEKSTSNALSITDIAKAARDFTRVDKVLVNKNFYTGFKEQANLVRDLIIYFSYCYQENLFGYGDFDPILFGKKMHYGRSRMFDKINVNDIERPALNTRIGDALFKLYNSHISIPKSYTDSLGNWSGLEKIEILDGLDWIEDVPRGKTLFKITLNEKFKAQINNHFIKFDVDAYTRLKSNNSSAAQELLIHLTYLKQKIFSVDATIQKYKELGFISSNASFNKLCELLSIEYSEAGKKKQKIQSIFNEVLKESPSLGCKLSWERSNNSKHSYVPVFIFTEFAEFTTEQRTALRGEIFNHVVNDELYDTFLTIINPKTGKPTMYRGDFASRKAYEKWKYSRAGEAEKRKVFTNAYNNMFKKYPITTNHHFVDVFIQNTGTIKFTSDAEYLSLLNGI